MHSMTGYARVVEEDPGARVAVEIRSVNNRFLKVTPAFQPQALAALEPEVIRRVKERVARGTVNVAVQCELARAAELSVNTRLLRAYRDAFARAFAEIGVDAGLAPDTLVQLPGVIGADEPDETAVRSAWPNIEAALSRALDELVAMRAVEGQFLKDDLARHLATIRREVAAIRARSPFVLADYRQRLAAKLKELLEPERVPLAPGDLLREVAIYADRTDISEEVARAESHLEQLDRALDTPGEVGRRLEFLAQELFREANTMGSKCADAEITRAIIEIKTALEKVKEQLQNIE